MYPLCAVWLRLWNCACQIIEVVIAVMSSDSQRHRCPLVTANALLYVAELCSTVKHNVIPLLPLFMPAVIQVATDLSLLARFVFTAVLWCKSQHVLICNECLLVVVLVVVFDSSIVKYQCSAAQYSHIYYSVTSIAAWAAVTGVGWTTNHNI